MQDTLIGLLDWKVRGQAPNLIVRYYRFHVIRHDAGIPPMDIFFEGPNSMVSVNDIKAALLDYLQRFGLQIAEPISAPFQNSTFPNTLVSYSHCRLS